MRYFKRTKNGVLDAVGRAVTNEYAQKLISEGFEEIDREYYARLVEKDLYISYRIE